MQVEQLMNFADTLGDSNALAAEGLRTTIQAAMARLSTASPRKTLPLPAFTIQPLVRKRSKKGNGIDGESSPLLFFTFIQKSCFLAH